MKGWKVASRPSSTPMARGATCTRIGTPRASAASTRARMRRHWSGSMSRCIREIDRGWPAAPSAIRSSTSNSASKCSGPRAMSKSLTACTTPCASPAKACAMPASSFASDSEAGVSSPVTARWLSERPVEKPAAPASSASRTMVRIRTMSSSVATLLATARSPIT